MSVKIALVFNDSHYNCDLVFSRVPQLGEYIRYPDQQCDAQVICVQHLEYETSELKQEQYAAICYAWLVYPKLMVSIQQRSIKCLPVSDIRRGRWIAFIVGFVLGLMALASLAFLVTYLQ
jgi:hypothetical protein